MPRSLGISMATDALTARTTSFGARAWGAPIRKLTTTFGARNLARRQAAWEAARGPDWIAAVLCRNRLRGCYWCLVSLVRSAAWVGPEGHRWTSNSGTLSLTTDG